MYKKLSIQEVNSKLERYNKIKEYRDLIVKFQPSTHPGWRMKQFHEKEGFAIIKYSYAEKYDTDDWDSVGIFILNSGIEISWYSRSKNLIPATQEEINMLRKQGYKI
jgi:hypothetical protein